MKINDFQADLFAEFGISESENSEKNAGKNPENSRKNFAENPENSEKNSEKFREKNDEKISRKSVKISLENDEKFVPEFTVSEATALFNQMFETATPRVKIVGEIANFKINQGKWVFFDLKDSESSLGCFMSVFSLRVAVEDGMKVAITARPNITKWGKFSLTVQSIRPVGSGSIKRAFDLLREKLEKEGLFDVSRKRILPRIPEKIGVISSVDAAGYKDFVKILGERFGGMEILVAPVQVQGEVAADQIRDALKYFNEKADVEVVAILRGGGSRDDLVAFDDEKLVREIAASRIPILTGIGHEIDTTLADLAADFRASTPSNAAEILVPDKREIFANLDFQLAKILENSARKIANLEDEISRKNTEMNTKIVQLYQRRFDEFSHLNAILEQLNPRKILAKGYAILRDKSGKILREKPQISDIILVENSRFIIESEVKNVSEK